MSHYFVFKISYLTHIQKDVIFSIDEKKQVGRPVLSRNFNINA